MTPSIVGVPKPTGLRPAGCVVVWMEVTEALGATVRVPLLLLLPLLLPTALFVCPMLSLPPKDRIGRDRTTVTSITSALFIKPPFETCFHKLPLNPLLLPKGYFITYHAMYVPL